MTNINIKQIEFKSTNGVNTVVGWIYSPTEQARGVVQISHGMAEHLGRYHEFMRFLAQNGYVAAGIDHIGHGRSVYERRYGFFAEQDGWKTLVDDQYLFNKIVRSESADCRCILLGHSMGSFVARLYAAKYPQSISGLVLSGTARGGMRVDAAVRMASRSAHKNGAYHIDYALDKLSFGNYNDRFAPENKGGFDWLTRDAEIVKQYQQDANCGFVFTASAFRDLFTLISRANDKKCYDGFSKDTPVLLISGTMDPVGEFGKGPKQVYERCIKAGIADTELLLYDSGRHEMLNETNRQQVWEDLLGWLNDHFAPLDDILEPAFEE